MTIVLVVFCLESYLNFLFADATISGGELVIDVSYFGFNVRTEKHNLCNETSCPVTAGDFEIAHSQVLPGYTPPVSYPFTSA